MALPFEHIGPDDPDILLLSAGPAVEACIEAQRTLDQAGVLTAHLHLPELDHFPEDLVAPVLTSARAVIAVQSSATADLAEAIRRKLGPPERPFELLRTAQDGFGPAAIVNQARRMLG